jgi:hypothetical protein
MNSTQAGCQSQISYGVAQEVSHRPVEAYTTNYQKAHLSLSSAAI